MFAVGKSSTRGLQAWEGIRSAKKLKKDFSRHCEQALGFPVSISNSNKQE